MNKGARETGRSGGQLDHETSYADLRDYGMNILPHEAEVGERSLSELWSGKVHQAGGLEGCINRTADYIYMMDLWVGPGRVRMA